ncbi:hypothetical protein QBC32DRAFT_364232 [Pseudoneurospora amorphoporcata]|uniref:Uncharacterized protein n=1 Tax=Pseudoneurospora amorphoporcata TaxID=241081 RepID=A0AAN6NSK2_9PEZI|nr:hypothetical protein QBC32DRAFT_364232 [Pseudoneurospora amorphoporcata]
MKTTTFLAILLPFISSISPALSATIPSAIPAAAAAATTTPGDVAPNMNPTSATHLIHDTSAGDGLYRVTIDSDGNLQTEFTPYDQLFNSTSTGSGSGSVPGRVLIGGGGGGLGSRSDSDLENLEKRRLDCGPGSTNAGGDADEANKCLVEAFAPGNVYFNKNAWSYCVRNKVVSFICPYSNGYKLRDAIESTMSYVKQMCGPSTMGYA